MDELKHLRGLIDQDWLKRLADPMAEIRQQMQAAYIDPLRKIRERMLDPFGMHAVADQFRTTARIPSAMQDVLDHNRRFFDESAQVKNLRAQLEVTELTEALEKRSEWDRMIEDIVDPIRGLGIDTRSYLDAIGLGPGSDLTRMLEQFREVFDELPDQIRIQIALLVERGWCLDPDMTHQGLREMVLALEDGNEAEVQEALIEHFEARLEDIEAILTTRHPHRAAILKDAFQAHREGRYALSVPVLLAQADGITFDRVERQLYSRKRNKGVVGYVEGLPEDHLLTVYWSVFTSETDAPLTRNTRALPAGFDGLNRHAVFHGTDPNYGTKVNSLRAVSVLNLASYLLAEGDFDPRV